MAMDGLVIMCFYRIMAGLGWKPHGRLGKMFAIFGVHKPAAESNRDREQGRVRSLTLYKMVMRVLVINGFISPVWPCGK